MRAYPRLRVVLVAALVAAPGAPLAAAASDVAVVATVKTAGGAAWVVRQGQRPPAHVGQ